LCFAALGGTQPEDDYNEANKRHTMSHPPEHIPDIDSQSPAKVKSPKEKKEKKEKVSCVSCFVLIVISQ
jgi:hypothetical protein